ncbi:hypothetical protein BU23DRAFT_604702 [Bimuria novae-zelandiae CBS 107.79]|uniref:Uncharacterized protein n=1 Tax=Bimuria novae-zelandiae CBS 107.79 TaxID=1447943 RepID=A0A6A5UJW8_9PLEO|nr:hypothetical protein BU23DRAFT_604702 [Bimuria novae-zelandiae CBS 107.79]
MSSVAGPSSSLQEGQALNSTKKLPRSELSRPPPPGKEESEEKSETNRERKTIAQLRKETPQKKEKLEDWNAPDLARSLGRLDTGHTSIYKYDSEEKSLAEVTAQLDRELVQEVADWVGIGGILRTKQVSVHSEEGICVDEKGHKVFFPPKYELPLFEWENEVERKSSTKSKDSSAKGSLECVPDVHLPGIEVADMHQKNDDPIQDTHSVE